MTRLALIPLLICLLSPLRAEAIEWPCKDLFAFFRRPASDPATAAVKYKLKPMISNYTKSDRSGKVFYVSVDMRARYEIRYDTAKKRWDFASEFPLADGQYYFAMDGSGTIYALRQMEDEGAARLQHSSLLAGEPAAAVGNLSVKEGKIYHIDGCSGHYRITGEFFEQVILEIRGRGASIGSVTPITDCR